MQIHRRDQEQKESFNGCQILQNKSRKMLWAIFFCHGQSAPKIGDLSPVSSSWGGLSWPLSPQCGKGLEPWGWVWLRLMVPLCFVLLQQPRPEEDRDHRGEPLAEDQQWQLLQLQHSQLPAQLPGWIPARLPGWLQRAQQSQRWAWTHPSAPGTLCEAPWQAGRARGLVISCLFFKKIKTKGSIISDVLLWPAGLFASRVANSPISLEADVRWAQHHCQVACAKRDGAYALGWTKKNYQCASCLHPPRCTSSYCGSVFHF